MDDSWYEDMKKRDAERDRKKAMCGDAPAPISDYKQSLEHEVSKIPVEVKQKILDLMKEGKNIGTVAKEVGLDSIIVGQIVSDNVVSYGSYLSSKVVK